MLRLPCNFSAYWSGNSAGKAGRGLILKNDFLQNFNPIDDGTDWEEIVPGRIAKLRRRGTKGALDIITVYMDAQEEE